MRRDMSLAPPDLSRKVKTSLDENRLLMVGSIGLLIAPSMQHRIVEQGEDTVRIHRATGVFAGAALLPFGISLGLAVYVVFEHLYGVKVGTIAAVTFCTVAAFFWYFLA